MLDPELGGPRRAGFGADRLGQDRRLRPGAGADAAWRQASASRRPARRWRSSIAPTRELALQVKRELEWLYEHDRRDDRVLRRRHGHAHARRRALERGAHIVVGTPGRLCDHIRRSSLDMSALKAVVLDEADEMLDLGFREDLEFILEDVSRRPPHADVFGDRTALDRDARQELPARRRAHQRPRPSRSSTSTSNTARCTVAPSDRENAIINVLRFYEATQCDRLLLDPRSRQSSDGPLQQPRLLGRGAVGRTQPERTHPRAAGHARRPRPRLHRDRRRRPRHRPAGPRTGHPRRPADQLRKRCCTAAAAPAAPASKGVSALIVPVSAAPQGGAPARRRPDHRHLGTARRRPTR